MVVACAGAFVLYDQKNGPEIQSDADTTGDGKVSNDPTSGFMSYDGHKYYLHYGKVSMYSSSHQSFDTSYNISFDAKEHGFLTGYVNNIQVDLSSNHDSVLYHQGSNNIPLTTEQTDSANSGLALLKQMQFVFTPLEEKNDISFTIKERFIPKDDELGTSAHYAYSMNYSGNYTLGTKFDFYGGNNFNTTYTINGSEMDFGFDSSYIRNYSNCWAVIGNAIYPVVFEKA